jgi:hypothetical protein
MWVIPKVTPEFEERMMDVLDTYAKPYDPDEPVVCLDEKNHQLLSDIRKPLKMKPGKSRRVDYEYKREGVRNEFVVVEPKAGKRHVKTTRKRKGRDWAKVIKFVTDKMYPEAKKIHLVEDNLNTHNEKYLIEVYGGKEAGRIVSRIKFHPTPKHASWLNMAEIEIGIFTRMVLKNRIANDKELKVRKDAYIKNRNNRKTKINWTFTRERATLKFKLK